MKTKSGFINNVISHVKHFLNKSYRDNIPALAGQSAFFIILSVVPLMMFAFAMLSILTGEDIESVAISLPELENYPLVEKLIQFVEDSIKSSGSGTLIVTAVVTLWSAGKGMYCITGGISRIYQLPNRSFWLFKRIFAMGYTVVILLMFLLCVGVMAFCIFFADTISAMWGGTWFKRLLFFLSYILFGLLQALLMTVALKMYLRGKLNNRKYHSIRALYPGMLLTVIAWNALTFGVMIYIRHFAVSSIYGSLGSIFMLMLWIYFMMYILLYGIQLDYIYRAYLSGAMRSKKGKRKKKKAAKQKA